MNFINESYESDTDTIGDTILAQNTDSAEAFLPAFADALG